MQMRSYFAFIVLTAQAPLAGDLRSAFLPRKRHGFCRTRRASRELFAQLSYREAPLAGDFRSTASVPVPKWVCNPASTSLPAKLPLPGTSASTLLTGEAPLTVDFGLNFLTGEAPLTGDFGLDFLTGEAPSPKATRELRSTFLPRKLPLPGTSPQLSYCESSTYRGLSLKKHPTPPCFLQGYDSMGFALRGRTRM
jgi:hypothetical protein